MVRNDTQNPDQRGNMARFGGMGVTFMVIIGMFMVGGYALGRLVGGMPVFVLAGLVLGFAAALFYLYVKLKELGGR